MPKLLVILVILLLSCWPAPEAMAACPSFGTAAHYSAPSFPRAIVAADFNGDGRQDFATANMNANNVAIRLGDGSGGFAAGLTAGAGTAPSGVAAGDFNGDGRIDLATSNSGGNNISILIGDGVGGFAAAVSVAGGSDPQSITTGDVNRDGRLDLVVTNKTLGAVSIFTGGGDGTFTHFSQFLTGANPVSAAVADFDGNGIPDLVVVNQDDDNVAIFNGFGTGTFAAPVYYTVENLPNGVALGDFNRDGSVDLAISTYSLSTSVLINNGSGTFASSPGSGSFSDVAVAGDFTGDGILDLALARYGDVMIMAGSGGGTFAVFGPEFTTGGNQHLSMAAADFNGDGRMDLAATDGIAVDVAVILNTSHCAANCASYTSGGSVAAGTGPIAVATGDFNRDGRDDLVVANSSSNNMSLLVANGSGTFASAAHFATGSGAFAVAVGDLNRDGKLDAVVSNPGALGFTYLAGNGAGLFSLGNKVDGVATYSVAIADFNRDGKGDVLLATASNNSVSVFLNTGPGAFDGPFRFSVGSVPFFATAADLNGDGKPDIVSANAGSDDVTVRLGDGAGSFAAPLSYTAGDGPKFIAVADFNRDGRPDLAVANDNANTVSILFGTGGGAFGAPVNYGVGELPRSIAVADLNLDGNPDLAVVNMTGQTVTVLTGSASGVFSPLATSLTGTTPGSVAVGDFNRDGKPDLAVANVGGNVTLLTNTCPAAELTVVKSHTGDFVQGQLAAQYTMVVSNSGNAPTTGIVSVVDALPSSLVATALSGTGWSCDLATLTCTRADALAQASSYSPITLTANVRSSAPAVVTNTATVSVGIELNPDDNTSADPTNVTANPSGAPTYLVATAQSAAQVNLAWDGVSGATRYRIVRTANGVAAELATPTATAYPDTAVGPNMSYVYQVSTLDESTNTPGTGSNKDIATTVFFTNDPLTPVIKAAHFSELRTAVQAARVAAGLPPATFTGAIAAGMVINAVHLTELRASLAEARSSLGLPAISHTDPSVTSGVTTVKFAHIVSLRNGVK